MAQESTESRISEKEYLNNELESEVKHEYIDGYAYAMAGGSANHNRISANILREFGNHLVSGPCEPFMADMKVKVGNDFYYPDVMVVCDHPNENEYFTQTPIILVEVVSRSTRRRDETTKRLANQSLPTLEEFVLIEQDFVDIEVCRKNNGWKPNHYFLGDSVTFESIELTVPVEEIYDRVVNEDMQSFLGESH